jgi:hypothetical protein
MAAGLSKSQLDQAYLKLLQLTKEINTFRDIQFL